MLRKDIIVVLNLVRSTVIQHSVILVTVKVRGRVAVLKRVAILMRVTVIFWSYIPRVGVVLMNLGSLLIKLLIVMRMTIV